ncbi:MAG: MmgE/PrpD family protein, partial [Verrucomicrobia bacterium]|nr:MmgE/PrpD family protein [Verrucomicrobiota bacterium]
DHCMQYMVAIGLLKGALTPSDYESAAATDPRIDWLRQMMHVLENPAFSKDYLDPQKRAVANAVQVFFQDGTQTERVQVDFPLGHRRRRLEGNPLLLEKFRHNVAAVFSGEIAAKITHWARDEAALLALTVNEFVSGLVKAR